MQLNDKVYNILKWVVILFLPGLATFYSLLAETWGLPYASEVPTTITGLATFLGGCLCVSTVSYNKAKKEENITDEQ